MRDCLGLWIEFSVDPEVTVRRYGRVVEYTPDGRQMRVEYDGGDSKTWFECRRVSVHGVFRDRPARVAPAPAQEEKRPEELRWNPVLRVVCHHGRVGVAEPVIDLEKTNEERGKRGLPVPWTLELGKGEAGLPPVV